MRLDLPEDLQECFWGRWLLLQPRSDWAVGEQRFAAGSLLIIDAADFLAGKRDMKLLFAPTPTRALAGYTLTREHVILNISDSVASRLGGMVVHRPRQAGASPYSSALPWRDQPVELV